MTPSPGSSTPLTLRLGGLAGAAGGRGEAGAACSAPKTLVLQLLMQGLELCFLCDFDGPQIHHDGNPASLVQRRYMASLPLLICPLFCSPFLCHVPAPLPRSLALRCT